MNLINNKHTFALISSVYSLNYQEFQNLSIDVYCGLVSDYELAAGLNSGNEIFVEVNKHWKRLLRSVSGSNESNKPPETPKWFLEKLKAMREAAGTDSVTMDFNDILKRG